MGFESTIAVESGRAKNGQRSQMLQLVWGYSKLQATRPKERPKNKRVKDTLTLFLTDSRLLIHHHHHQQPT
jgi:hypothetical protein